MATTIAFMWSTMHSRLRRVAAVLVLAAAGALTPDAIAVEPYEDPAYDARLRQLLLGDPAEGDAGDEVRAGLWRARSAAGLYPSLRRLGQLSFGADRQARRRLKVQRVDPASGREIDTKYVELGLELGPSALSPFSRASESAVTVNGGYWRWSPASNAWTLSVATSIGEYSHARDASVCRWTTGIRPPPDNSFNCWASGEAGVAREVGLYNVFASMPLGQLVLTGWICEPNVGFRHYEIKPWGDVYTYTWNPPDPPRCVQRVASNLELDCAVGYAVSQDYAGQPVDVEFSSWATEIDLAAARAALAGPCSQEARDWVNAHMGPQGPPVPMRPPAINGEPEVGVALTADPGAWDGAEPITLDQRWRHCVAETGVCFDLPDGPDSYVPSVLDTGLCLELVVTATNTHGSQTSSSRKCHVRPPLTDELAAALRYRPHLLFDSEEPRRPLNVNYLFAESGHRLCTEIEGNGHCTSGNPIFTACWLYEDCSASLTAPLPNRFRSIDLADPPAADATVGPGSVIYYNATQKGAYTYFDYWIFYRFNEVIPGVDAWLDHQGDWEGVVVATESPDGSEPPAFVTFAQHGGEPARYLSRALEYAGTHVRAYVAKGTHASYPFPCVTACTQNKFPWIEARFDGGASWGWNGSEDCGHVCVHPIPEANSDPTARPFPAGWAAWEGLWGSDKSPASPGWQPRYAAPWDYRPLVVLALATAADAALIVDCESWFGYGVSAVACDAERVRRALEEGELDEPGEAVLSVRGRERESAGAPGIGQLVGGPLALGDVLEVRGRVETDSSILVRTAGEDSPVDWEIDASQLGLEAGGSKAVVVRRGRDGRPIARVNRLPSCGDAKPSPALLWPPSGRLVPVSITGVSDPDADPVTIEVEDVTSDEPGLDDVVRGQRADEVLLRARRDGTGDGRAYTVPFTASDGIESCRGKVTVTVPHDRR